MQVCEGCGAARSDSDRFCPTCGRAFPGEPAAELKPRLVFEKRAQRAPFELGARTSFGRLARNTIAIADPIVSKEHCVLEARDQKWVLRDLGSLNGTYVNGQRVVEEVTLRDGDVIMLGSTRIVFRISTSGSAAPPALARSRMIASPWPAASQPAPAPFQAAHPTPQARPAPEPAGGPRTLAHGSPLAPASPAAQGSPEASDAVSISAVYPELVAPGSDFLVDVVLHLAGYGVEGAPGFVTDQDLAALRLLAGAKLTLRFCLDEQQATALLLDQAEEHVTWFPPSSRVSFRCKVADGAAVGTSHVRVEVGAGEVSLCHFYIELSIAHEAPAPPRRRHAVVRKLPRSAFASYATPDRSAVCARLESIQALGIDVFLDCLNVQQGANWEQTLAEAVVSKDVFLLFWSTAASHSRWVDLEWRSALAARGLGYIVPNTLEPAQVCPPPAALASLQFGSPFALLRA